MNTCMSVRVYLVNEINIYIYIINTIFEYI